MSIEQPAHIKAIEKAREESKARLHVFVAETHTGQHTISCLYALTPKEVVKEVIYEGDGTFDALRIVRLANKSMNATDSVVTLLIDMYARHQKLSDKSNLLY